VGEPYVESFNGRVRDELLNLEEFTSLTVAQVVVEAWRIGLGPVG
jgi:putative transposase